MKRLMVLLVAAIFGFATSASALSLVATTDKATYTVGETISVTVTGDPTGGTAATTMSASIHFDSNLASGLPGTTQQLVLGFDGALLQEPGIVDVFNQIAFVPTLPAAPFTAQATLSADNPGTLAIGFGSSAIGGNPLNFFPPPAVTLLGTSVTIVPIPEPCNDGLDNDGDGLTDYPDDPGCADAEDLSERSPLLPCDDGADNDTDGMIDFDPVTYADPGDENNLPSGSGDPGCISPSWGTESPQCQDGINNDGDGMRDYDAGLSTSGAADPIGPDPQCVGRPWGIIETNSLFCGLGAELALLLPPLTWLYRRGSRRG